MIILPSSYLAPVSYFKLISESPQFAIETKEHFIKQTYRNRCYIYGANGNLSLSIPLQKRGNRTTIDQVKISYEENWQKIHWKSMESAYRTSPYFEFYEEEFRPFYKSKDIISLLEFNQKIQQTVLNLIKQKVKISLTDKYETTEKDWRKSIHPKNKEYTQAFHFPNYMQVFEDKYGFIPNLSIIDVLFNLGPRTMDYINSVEIK